MLSLRWRLALLFLAILLAAIAVIYLYVLPQLESSLRAEKERALAAESRVYSRPIVRGVVFYADARHIKAIVRQAADRSGSRVTLLGVSRVVVYSSSLSDVQGTVELIRRRVLIAGGIALVIGVLGGFLVARALARKVKRLEQAAERVAAGDFSHPIPVESSDEIGELALAFNDMQRQLAQLDSARKRFIATASHELRTPIHSLGGFVELLQDEELDEEERRAFLEQISEQVDRLRNLSVDLLDLSKLEAGSLELHPEPTDVGALAKSVTAEFTPTASQHHSKVDVQVNGDDIEASCDPDRVAQIVRILLDNALTHTPQGTRIEVAAARENGQVNLTVQDHGLGIKRAVLPRVFEPFYTSDDVQGSGLGLAIARELAERMDGRLNVESVPGRTTFTLELPA